MPKYRKKPVVVEAFQITQSKAPFELGSWPSWLVQATLRPASFPGSVSIDEKGALRIHTLEGYMSVSEGDWIILGVEDEIYPCKPDIFVKTYDEVVEDTVG